MRLALVVWLSLLTLAVAAQLEEVEVTTSSGGRRRKRKRKLKNRKQPSGGSPELPPIEDGSVESSMHFREKLTSDESRIRYAHLQKTALLKLEQKFTGTFPAMDSHYRISNKQRKQFREQGYVLLRGLASPEEVAFYRQAINRVVNMDVHPLTKRPGFIRVYNLWDKSKMTRAFVLARRFGQVAADLLQVDGVRLYQDQIFHKFVGDKESPLHQDNYASPVDTNLTMGLWMPLVPITAEMGTLEFYPGSHLGGRKGQGFNYDESDLNREFGPRVNPGGVDGMQPGDVTIHNGWLIHRANPNRGTTPREAIAIQYFADGAVRNGLETQRGSYRHDSNSMSRWADNFQHGQVIDSKFTPLVFSY